MSRISLDSLPPHYRAQVEAQIGPAASRATDASPRPTNPVAAPPAKHPRRRSIATTVDGITFDSQTEARVYQRLRDEIAGTPLRLYLQPRLPVWGLGSNDRGRPHYVKPDFAIVEGLKLVRIVDAKPKKKVAHSRDWNRGKRALEACYGVAVEECER